MQIVSFSRIQSAIADVMRLQDNLVKFFRQLESCPFLDGKLITRIVLPTTKTRVYHGLGRVPIGCIIIGGNSYPVPIMLQRSAVVANNPTSEYCILYTTDTGTDQFVDIWVF